jgi:vacuolar-type H+-ATPase subunit H
VPALGEILRRFRFHGVPGAPSAVAVPADRTAELERELAPVFAALEEAEATGRAVVERARRDADRRRADATTAARRVVSEATAGAGAARTEAATAIGQAAEATRLDVLAAARAEADRVAAQAAERVPALVEAVVAHVLAVGAPDSGRSR